MCIAHQLNGTCMSRVMKCAWTYQLSCYSPEIVTPPESVVVFTDSGAEFVCEARNAPAFTWRVNGTFLGQLDPSLRADLDTDQETVGDNELYTLTIPARAEYNGTVVQCVVFGGEFRESGNATLTIQGIAEANTHGAYNLLQVIHQSSFHRTAGFSGWCECCEWS